MYEKSIEEICRVAIDKLKLNYDSKEKDAFLSGAKYMTRYVKSQIEKILNEKKMH